MCTQWWDLGIRTHSDPTHGHWETNIWTLGYIGVYAKSKSIPSMILIFLYQRISNKCIEIMSPQFLHLSTYLDLLQHPTIKAWFASPLGQIHLPRYLPSKSSQLKAIQSLTNQLSQLSLNNELSQVASVMKQLPTLRRDDSGKMTVYISSARPYGRFYLGD